MRRLSLPSVRLCGSQTHLELSCSVNRTDQLSLQSCQDRNCRTQKVRDQAGITCPLCPSHTPELSRLLCVASASARDGEVVGSWTSGLITSSMMGMTAGESLLRFRRFGGGAVRGYIDTFHYFPHHGIMGPLYHSVSTILTSLWDIQDADFSIFNIQGEKAIGFLN